MNNHPHIVRCKKHYQQYQFHCIIPKDLINVLGQTEFVLSIGNSLYSHSKITSTNLYNLSKFIIREVRWLYGEHYIRKCKEHSMDLSKEISNVYPLL